MQKSQRILVVDVETTGFDPERNACIELGAVLLNGSLETEWEFSSLIVPWPGAEISAESLAVSGIGLETLRSAESAESVIARLDQAVSRVQPIPILAGWNVWFDAAFLKSMYRRAGIAWSFGHRLFDVQSVFTFFSNLTPVSQQHAIRDYLGELQSHRALDDARHTSRLLQILAKRISENQLGTAIARQCWRDKGE